MNRKQRRAEKKLGRSPLPGVQAALDEGLRHHQAGRLNEAEHLYRQVLTAEPENPDGLHLLGMIAYQVGRADAAEELIGQAVALNGDVAFYHCNLGLVRAAQGKLDAAAASYRRALALKPDYVEACNNLGNALKDQSKPDEALAAYARALALKPDLAEAHNNIGNVRRGQGRLDEAIASYRQALAVRPGYADAYVNLGVALADQGKLDEAVAAYRQALALKPDSAEAHNNLGNALKAQGQTDEAAACYRQALKVRPTYPDALNNLALLVKVQGDGMTALALIAQSLQIKNAAETQRFFVDIARQARCTRPDGAIQSAFVRALTEPWCRPHVLAHAGVECVKLNPVIAATFARAAAAWPQRLAAPDLFGADGLAALAGDAVFAALLGTVPIADIGIERCLTMARRALLTAAATPDNADDATLTFYSALARQCFINEYVYAHADDEIREATALRDSLVAALEAGNRVPALGVLAVAAYFPLVSLPSAARLIDGVWPAPVDAVVTQQVREPLEEQRLRATIPQLTRIADDVSQMVREHYEENPYPRWVKTAPAGVANDVHTYLRQKSPVAFKPQGSGGTRDFLIAGCGTGQHSIGMAQLFKGARVLAVDLSLSSLSYAKRKTQELGLTTIDYAQADILELGTLGRQFDVIGSVGVLHHLADPFAGWRVLLSLLHPGGVMSLGFYSEVARRGIVKARDFIAARGYAATADDIRRCRQDLIEAGNFGMATTTLDFFSTSMCRDLLFHAQEHRLTLAEIDAFLRDNGLTFLGFELDGDVLRAYKQRFPEDPAATDLGRWQIFENEKPDTFIGMYQFWVQKAG